MKQYTFALGITCLISFLLRYFADESIPGTKTLGATEDEYDH